MKPLVVLLFVAFGVKGYDWTDSDFNSILQDDFLDGIDYVEGSLDHHRIVRQVTETTTPAVETTTDRCRQRTTPPTVQPGNNRYQRTCCGDRDDLKMHGDALREIRRECFVEVRRNRALRTPEDAAEFDMFQCDRITKNKDELVCVMECVAKRKNLTDTSGNIAQSSATAFVKEELVNQEWQKKIIDSILEKCLNETNTSTVDNASIENNISNDENNQTTSEKPRSLSKDNSVSYSLQKCNPSAIKFSHCIWKEMQLSCPLDMIRDSRYCQRLRERLQKKEYPDFVRGPWNQWQQPKNPKRNRTP